MPREGAIIFRDLVGKLDVLRITCEKCGRAGQYAIPTNLTSLSKRPSASAQTH
jgi:hypothetical protein